MKRKYIVAALPSSSFGGFADPFSCLFSSIKYMTYEINGYINQNDYETIVKELWEQQKLCLVSITDVTACDNDDSPGEQK